MSKTRMGKRVASLLLSLVMMLSLLPTTVYAEGADTGDTTDEIVGQATTSGDNTEGTGEPEPTGEGEDGSANVTEGEDGAATNDAVVEETIAPVNAEGVDAVANAESSGDEVSGEEGNEATSFVTVNGGTTQYATLEEAIAAAEPVNGVITYTINGKVDVTATDWIQVAKAGLTGLTAVKFVGATDDAEICITGKLAILADQNYDINVSFENLTLSKLNPTNANDYGHSTEYFTTWLRNANQAENTVTYTKCTFPNGVSNNQYGKTVFDNCQFTNATGGLYNLWNYGGNTEVKNSTFTGVRGIKAYSEGTDGGSIKVAGTKFDNLTQKAAIVASKPVNVEVSNVDVTGEKGFFTRDITGKDEVQLTVAGTGISGTFEITSATDAGAAKNEFNISAGTFTSEVPNDYCADGFEVKASTDASGNTTYGVEKAATAVAKIGDKEYATLADAIDAAKTGDTVTLLADTTEDVTIDKNITLDLGGKTLTNTNAGKATISVSNGATATVKNGSVMGGTSYYNIEVTKGSNANLTLEDVTATAGNNGSSMIDNWGTLTINSGTYTGGLNVVKSEEGSKLTITGGTFTLNYATNGYTGVVFAYGDTTISGGEFIQSLTTTGQWNHPTVILTGVVEGYTAITRVTGGHFVNNMSGESIFRGVGKGTSDNFEVSGGTFNKSVSDSFFKEGYFAKKTADGYTAVGPFDAKIGTTGYATLEAAFAAAKSGNTITLLRDCSGNGIVVKDNRFTGKGLTVDFAGHTYTVGGVLVGSATTGTNAFQLLPGNKITFKNGTIAGVAENTKPAEDTPNWHGAPAIVIQNYCDLTLKNMTVSGGDETVYTMSNNCGNVVIENTTINAGKAKGYTSPAVAFDVCRYSSYPSVTVTVKGNSVINGDVEVSGTIGEGQSRQLYVTGGKFTGEFKVSGNVPANITVSGGTFTSAVPAEYCADGFIPTKNADGTYGVKNGSYVAEYNGTKYESLAEAITAAKSGATVTLLADCASDRINLEEKSITVDLNGKTLTSTAAYGVMFCAKNGNTITINGTAEGSKLVGTLMVTSGTNGHIVINDGTYESDKYCPIYINGAVSTDDSTLTVTNATIEALAGSSDQDNGVAVYLAGYSTSTFTNTTITAPVTGLEIRAGKLTLTDCNVTGGNGTVAAKADGNGSTVANAAVAISQHTTKKNIDVTINGGTYTATAAVYQTDVQKTGSENVKASIESGMFNGTVSAETNNTVAVSGGSFSSAVPENCCANGYIPTKNESGTYGVKEGSYVAETNNVKYETLQAAIDAAARKATVTMLADTKENVTISTPYLTLDLNGFTLNGSTGERKPALTITARVTVKDSSVNQTGTIMREDTAGNSGVSSHYVIDVQDGWLTFESGIVQNDSGNAEGKGASLVRVGDDSVKKYPGLTIKGGTFTQDNFIAIKVARGTLYLNDGEVNSANSYAIENWHNATIKGGTVNGTVAAWTYSGGHNSTLEISGGTIKGNVASVSYDKAEGKLAKVSITGGTVTGTLGTYTYNNGLESITDAAKATIEVTGGTFSNDPAKYVVENSAVTPNADGTFGVKKAYLAKVGNTSYYTMEEAFKAQTASGEPIVMLRDYTTGSSFWSGSIDRTVELGGHTWTCTGTDANSAAFEINYPNASLTVKNGKIVSSQLVGLIPSASGGTYTYDNSSLTFENVKMSTTATSGIETNGNNTNDTVTLKDSTLDVPNGFGIYFPSSGKLTIDNSTITAKTMGVQVCAGSLSINAGSAITVSGDAVSKTENDGAIQDGAAISIVNRPGYKGLGDVTVTGGKFTAKTGNAAIKAYDWANNTATEFTANDKVFVSGGSFNSAVPEGLCKDGYISVANGDGTYTVKKGTYVAQVGSTKYESLAAAIGAAQDGDTVTLLKDIDLPATAVVEGKTITLELNGKTLANTKDIWDIAPYDWSLISVREGGNLTINGSGALRAKENDCYALDVQDGGNLTVNGDASYVGNIHAIYVQKGTATVNGGSYSVQQKYPDAAKADEFVLNCYDANRANGTAKIIVNGGTFTNFDPRNNKAEGAGTSFVAEGVGVNNENGTFTAVPNMAAQIIAAGGGSVAAYAGHYDAIAAAKDGETVILLSDRKNFVTNTINANITIDLNGKTLSFGNNNPFFRTNGEVTIQNGTIESNYACAIVNAYNKLTLKNVKITGVTGNNGKNLVNVCSNAEVTIDKDTVLTASGSNGAAVFIGQDADAKYTLNVYGKVIRESKSFAISGNGSYKGTTTINIYDGAEVRSASVAIYHPQAGVINVNGGLVEGYCAIGIKSGSLNIKGGTVRGTANDHILDDSDSISGTIRYDGSAIVVDSRTDYKGDVKINISGDALVQSSYSTAIREIGKSAETTNVTALNVTGGKVLGASGKAAIQLHGVTADVTSISGGTYSTRPEDSWVVNGYRAIENTDGTYTVKEANIAIQVTSRIKDDGVTTVSTTTGGGMYCEGEKVTVTTSNVVGFKFLGWYEKDSYMTPPLSADLSYTFTASKNCTLVALYSPAENATLTVKVTASAFRITGSRLEQNNGGMYKLPVGSSVTVTYTDDTYTFLYWVNGSDKIVSTSPEYTFTLGSNTELRACTSPKNTENDNAMVVFKTAYDQVLTAKRYGNDEEIVFPMGPSKTGYKFIGWRMTQAKIRAAMAENDYIVVTPEYETLGSKYTVTVKYEGIDKADDTHTLIVGDSILLTAETEVDGKTFSCWKIGNEVVSYLTTLTVFDTEDVTVTAVYGEKVTAEATIRITGVTTGRNGNYYQLIFSESYAVPETATFVQTGFVGTASAATAENLTLDTGTPFVSKLDVPEGSYEYTMNLSRPTMTVYMKAYVQYMENGELQTLYSDMVSASYNSLTKGGNN